MKVLKDAATIWKDGYWKDDTIKKYKKANIKSPKTFWERNQLIP